MIIDDYDAKQGQPEAIDFPETVIGRAERNAAYLRKLERGLAQVHAGAGITKTMEELKAMVYSAT